MLEDAIASWDKASEIKPDYHEAWYGLGITLYNLGLLEDAIASYDKALEIKPDKDKAWYNRSIAVSNAPGYNKLVYEILQGQFPKSPPVNRSLVTHKVISRVNPPATIGQSWLVWGQLTADDQNALETAKNC